MMLEVGDMVPPLEGVIQDGSLLSLAQLRGRRVVVYFYPKDNTTGCTREAQDFRDLYGAFRKHHCTIVGVSRDTVAAHARFRQKQEIPFSLLADTDERWCHAFGVLGEKVLYGKRHIGVIRSTFLLDAEGILAAQWRGTKVAGHAAAVLERLAHP